MPKAVKKDLFTQKPTKVVNGRYFFSESEDAEYLPNLIQVQLDSYDDFLKNGIHEMLQEISPLQDFSGKKVEVHFLKHSLEDAKIDPETAKRDNLSYEANLKVEVKLVNKETGEIKQQEVFLGVMPLMTEKGTFVINGIERVVVNQIVRSPGAFFSRVQGVPGAFATKIIPRRGVWLEIESDKKKLLYAKIDRKRKFPATQLMRIFGYETDADIIEAFGDMQEADREVLMNTLEKDSAKTVAEAYQSIYRKIRPGDMATAENAKSLVDSMFFDFRKYDLGPIARYKLNKRFNLDKPDTRENRVFQISDFLPIMKELIKLTAKTGGSVDDIDHLQNRRIRSVGELVMNKFRVGLMRVDRIAKDRMTVVDLEAITAVQIVNSRPITAAMREFFASSQLSQFMDQINPLAELAHKRRISTMGPGGLSRERAGFDVRDVHSSHFGRICPIATPEGPNIGLVLHFATYAKVNQYGFITTPLQLAKRELPVSGDLVGRILNEDIAGGKSGDLITEELAKKIAKSGQEIVQLGHFVDADIHYLDAAEEQDIVVGQLSGNVDDYGNVIGSMIPARIRGEASLVPAESVTHFDISSKQIVSETTALIPFLENDDNTRASMGSNMQRQAVPLINPHAPIVGTGLEGEVARAAGTSIIADEDGEITEIDAREITVQYNSGKRRTYELPNYIRSNQTTCFHFRPDVSKGEKVVKGQTLINGASTENGELALGQNLVVAYMPWEGYNYEDAIIISDKVAQEGYYDSIHIESFAIDIRETKLGNEQVTRDIPNVGDAKLSNLDEDGIVRVGSWVNDGDIMVGKITPKGEVELTPEEQLLQSIFGEKAKDVRDSSLRLPGGEGGKVIDIQIFTKEKGHDLHQGVLKQIRVYVAQTRKIQVGDKMAGRHGNKGVISKIVAREDMPFLADGTYVDIILNPLGVSSRMNIGQILETHLGLVGKKMGVKFATPVLNGISSQEITQFLKDADLPEDGKTQLFDGKTGDPFQFKTTMGITYMIKLNHLVEDKLHARSVGPYSIVTQQPLGGKAQQGGQRFGEMEVWALEAYSASHILREMLTIKSDDVVGRSKAYEAIVKGLPLEKPSIPESFNVLLHELQGLGLEVDLENDKNEDVDLELDKMYTDENSSIPEEDKVSELNTKIHETDAELNAEVHGEIPPVQEGEV
ncbi:TPA: DNA-directed RNA polymerase subunit beta [Candidatus Gracilibacteria bacterium]|nr:DNA-directed RNA polymerase subunit beta [Candidatus Gracilibacteria bacterium]